MKLTTGLGASSVCLIFVVATVAPSAAFVVPSSGNILNTNNAANAAESLSKSALLAVDVAFVNDAMDINNSDILLPAAGAAVVAAIGAAVGMRNGNGSKATASKAAEEEVPKIDVSIPYDAPAQLAFSQMPKGKRVEYAKFKDLYEGKAVAEVKKKVYGQKVAMEMERMDKEIEEMQKEMDGMFS
mmetsp:Transcript_4157/g.7137  ORF Transcript_4157/g.7137 Transcript_4157/m.7137 type:complete len:185 (-) Transcript_4157:265-819(-)